MAIQIIPEYKKRSSADRFAEAFSNASNSLAENVPKHFMQQEAKKNKNEQLNEFLGTDVSNLPEDFQKLAYQAKLQQQNQAAQLEGKNVQAKEKQQQELREKIAPFEAGLQTIKQMRQIGKAGNLGRGSSVLGFFGGQTAKDRAQYEQLGKSLISLASTIPIRNKSEFETLAHNLYDPSLPDDARDGILDAMENIIERNMSAFIPQEEEKAITSANKERTPLKDIFS